VVPEIFGTTRVAGNLIWSTDLVETAHTEEVGGGGKGGGGGQSVTTYTYSCSFAMAVCRGPVAGIRRIWADNRIIYNVGDDADDETVAASERLAATSLFFYKGTDTQSPDPTIEAKKGAGKTPAFRNICYIVFKNFQLADYGNRIPSISIEVVQNGELDGGQIRRVPVSLASVITTLSQRAGLTSSEVDVSELTQDIEGFTIHQDSYRTSVEELMKAFSITAVLSGDKIKFVPKDTEPVLTIAETELGATDGDSVGENLGITRTQEVDLPKMVQISYVDNSRDYMVGTQIAQRTYGSAINVSDTKFNVVMSPDYAAAAAEKMLYEAWINRMQYRFSLGPKYLFLEPGDVIVIQKGGIQHTVQLTKCDIGANGIIQCSGVAHDAAVFTSSRTGSSGENITGNSLIKVPGPTTAHFFDLPPLLETDNNPGFYVACSGDREAWKKGIAYRSVDGGVTYQYYFPVSRYSVVGTADTQLGAGKHTVWDDVNTVEVSVLKGELESVSDQVVLAGGNAALIGDEIIQYANATLIGDNTYLLSRLLRGRRGTEWAISQHVPGERFIRLADCERQKVGMTEIGAPRTYKVVAIGGYLADEESFDFSATGESLRPFSPVHLKGTRDEAGTINITWVRRGRLGGELMPGTDIPLSEELEQYQVEVMRDSSTVARIITVSDVTSAVYTLAEQQADFGSIPSSVSINVYQLSAAVGRGRPATAVI
jgi:hypothetical protein